MNETVKNKILEAKTLNDFLNVLLNYFDCVSCAPSSFILSTLVYKLVNLTQGTNVIVTETTRVKAINAKNIKEFIEIIQSNFDLNKNISEAAKKDLISNTEILLKLTKLKEKQIDLKIYDSKLDVVKDPIIDRAKKLFKRNKK